MIKIRHFNPTQFIIIAVLSCLTVACVPQTPIPIFITPTLGATSEAQAVEPSAEVEPTDSQPPTLENIVIPTIDKNVVPTISSVASPTLQPVVDSTSAPTSSPTQQSSQATIVSATPVPTIESEGEFIGAIIGEGYTLPPTSTPRPTQPPQPTAPPTVAGTAFTTPLPDTLGLDGARMGIQLYYNFGVSGWDATLAQASQMRVDWIKLQAAWDWLQPDAEGQFDQNFRLFQLHVQEADKRGFKVMISIAKAPDWTRNVDRNEDGPPDDPAKLVGFINFLLQQIGPNIDAIEVWNEPNLKREWTGGRPISGGAYMEIFRPAYDAIRAYSRDITIITAGLAPTGTSAGVSVSDRLYLQQMYNAGLAQYTDVVVGIHPYSWGNPPDFTCCDNIPNRGWDDEPEFFFKDTIEDYHDIMQRNGHNVQMWATEFGWATWEGYPTEPPDTWMTYNTPTDQMNYTLRAFEIAQDLDYMGVMILWNLNFANETIISQRSELAGYSLLFPGFNSGLNSQERPLFGAIARRP